MVNPDYIQSAGTGTVQTKDVAGYSTDGATNIAITDIVAGAVSHGHMSLPHTKDTPALDETLKLKFRAHGSIKVGYTIKMVLPNDGWIIAASPAVTVKKPVAGVLDDAGVARAAVTMTATWDPDTFILLLVTAGAD